MVEVKLLMNENVLLIDVSMAVVHYSGTGHTGVVTGGVRFDLCAEEEREVMEHPEGMETRR